MEKMTANQRGMIFARMKDANIVLEDLESGLGIGVSDLTKYLVEARKDERATQINTLLKMAKKRSFVDGILSITGASRIFTQDVEDF